LRDLPPTIQVTAGIYSSNALNCTFYPLLLRILHIKIPLISSKWIFATFLSLLLTYWLAAHDLYSWGRGEYAVFGDGSNKNLKSPTKNESVKRIRDTEGVIIKKIKSCGSQTLALTGYNIPIYHFN